MLTTHATLAALLALSSGQWIQPRIFDQPNLRAGNGRETPTYFEFAPSSGAGLPVAEDLCDALAAEVPGWSTPVDGGAGNWCLKGNGTTAAGSEVAFEAVGSPTLTTATVCPSGPDCVTKDVIQLSSTSAYAATAARASGTGAMTACWWGSSQIAAQEYMLSAATGTSAAAESWHIDYFSGAFRFLVSNGSAFSVASGSTGVSVGSVTLVCGAYAGGTSAPAIYSNGTAGTPGSASARQSLSAKATVSGVNGAASFSMASANHLGAFYVDQELSAAQIAAIARRVLADQPKAVISGSPSLAMTYTRTGSMFCSKADNTGSIIPANRPCIARNGVLVEGAATNLVYNSQALDAATWDLVSGASVAMPTRTANYAAAPDGTKTAERFVFPATEFAGSGYWTVVADNSMAATPTHTNITNAVYIKGTSGSGTIDVCLSGVAGAWLCNTACNYTASAWTRCSISYSGGTAVRGSPIIGHGSQFTGITRPQNDVLLWGAQVETGSVATSYIPTTSAAAARGVALPYFDLGGTVGPSAEKFSAALTTYSAGYQLASQQYASLLRASHLQTDTAGRGVWIYSNASSGTTMRCITGNDAGGLSLSSSIAAATGRAACWTDGSALNFTWGAGTATPGGASSGAYSKTRWIDVGNQQGSPGIDAFGGFLGRFCFDPRPTRCR